MPIIITTNYVPLVPEINRPLRSLAGGVMRPRLSLAGSMGRLTEMCSGIEMIWDDWRTK